MNDGSFEPVVDASGLLMVSTDPCKVPQGGVEVARSGTRRDWTRAVAGRPPRGKSFSGVSTSEQRSAGSRRRSEKSETQDAERAARRGARKAASDPGPSLDPEVERRSAARAHARSSLASGPSPEVLRSARRALTQR